MRQEYIDALKLVLKLAAENALSDEEIGNSRELLDVAQQQQDAITLVMNLISIGEKMQSVLKEVTQNQI